MVWIGHDGLTVSCAAITLIRDKTSCYCAHLSLSLQKTYCGMAYSILKKAILFFADALVIHRVLYVRIVYISGWTQV